MTRVLIKSKQFTFQLTWPQFMDRAFWADQTFALPDAAGWLLGITFGMQSKKNSYTSELQIIDESQIELFQMEPRQRPQTHSNGDTNACR